MFETELARASLPIPDRHLYPILKAPDWPHRGLCAHLPLPGLDAAPALPIVAFGENGPQGYVFLTARDADGLDLSVLYRQSVQRLARVQRPFTKLSPKLLAHAGSDLAAEVLLDEAILRASATAVGCDDLLVCVPHRAACYILAADAPVEDRAMLTGVMMTERDRMGRLGHAPVSDLMFRVRDGKIVGTAPLVPLAAPAAQPRAGFHWLAAFVFGFLGFVVAFGIALGLVASETLKIGAANEGMFILTVGALGGLAAGLFAGRKR